MDQELKGHQESRAAAKVRPRGARGERSQVLAEFVDTAAPHWQWRLVTLGCTSVFDTLSCNVVY